MRRPPSLVLTYHRLAERLPDPRLPHVAPRHFAQQLAVLGRRVELVPLGELVARRHESSTRARVAVTFDDGYASTLHTAAPALNAHGIPATVFVVVEALDRPALFWGEMLQRCILMPPRLPPRLGIRRGLRTEWLDVSAATRRDLYLRLHVLLHSTEPEHRLRVLARLGAWAGVPLTLDDDERPMRTDELIQLAALPGIEIGAHTMTHPRLALLSARRQFAEIARSREALGRILGGSPHAFAYPYGAPCDLSRTTPWLVRAAGFEIGCLCDGGVVRADCDRFRVPRVMAPDLDADAFAAWLVGCLDAPRSRSRA